MKTNDNKPSNPMAFATASPSCSKYDGVLQEGMTLRDYFANSAMQGIMTNQDFLILVLKQANGLEASNIAISKEAYGLADAMLKQRELTETT